MADNVPRVGEVAEAKRRQFWELGAIAPNSRQPAVICRCGHSINNKLKIIDLKYY